MKAVLVVHGGAWTIPDDMCDTCTRGVKDAAVSGFHVLKTGGTALDAVEMAVRTLEDNPAFDAGYGSVLNAKGDVEMDAIIMDGLTCSAGAVSCVRNIANPVTLARAVMEKTDHVMLTDRGANLFAESVGIPSVPSDALVTKKEREAWQHNQKYAVGVKNHFNSQWDHDTVGAVALDCHGNVACATSTGGIRNKMVGRVGDSPIIGCGGYADNRVGAVSCTGHGESIMKATLASRVLFAMEQGKSPSEAVESSLKYMGERVKGGGGVIAVTHAGDWVARFTTQRMTWAAMDGDTLFFGLNPGEMSQERHPL
ncbi:hypothetical protein GJAV_G00239160 [Gymnothorax javanicus]|nr:hypothetical protein GJAV_G00239160 [Gymnothorax javanicus]